MDYKYIIVFQILNLKKKQFFNIFFIFGLAVSHAGS